MRLHHFAIFIFFATISCSQNVRKDHIIEQDYLSKWFIANEDSLYNEFEGHVAKNSLCAKCDTTWGEMAYIQFDSVSYMGRFSHLVTKYCDSLQVTYFYNRNGNKTVRILLSTGYNRKFVKALDTIFSSALKPHHFIIEKYEQPDKTSDIFSLQNNNIIVKDLRIKMKPIDSLQDVTVFIRANPKKIKLSKESLEYLKEQLFGEEILLKKINKVNFRFTDSVESGLQTMKEMWKSIR